MPERRATPRRPAAAPSSSHGGRAQGSHPTGAASKNRRAHGHRRSLSRWPAAGKSGGGGLGRCAGRGPRRGRFIQITKRGGVGARGGRARGGRRLLPGTARDAAGVWLELGAAGTRRRACPPSTAPGRVAPLCHPGWDSGCRQERNGATGPDTGETGQGNSERKRRSENEAARH